MIELNEKQVLHIEHILEQKGLKNNSLKEELLDHICCQTEKEMAGGLVFSQALKKSLDAFQEDEIKDLQQHFLKISNKKRSIMTKVTLFAFSVLLLVVFNLNQKELTVNVPAAEEENTAYMPAVLFIDPPDASPLKAGYKVTSGFGWRMHPIYKVKKHHDGIDLKAPAGTPVYATSDGTVVKVAFYKKGYGKHIVIQHDDHFKTLYAQLSRMDVEVGEQIKKGDLIGAVGSSGMSTAPHLHYEVIKDGVHEDPEEYLRP
ncbi:MAG TPA: M23 family metallopeptidase [Bacteroidetes bacterium]|nr:M23 family metallopeptidase [Bacteroidota bacterium]